MRCIFEQKILKNVPHCNITDNRTLLVSLLWGDGRHFAFTHTTDRPKFNCSCAAPRSVRGCWTVTTWETQRDQLWSVAHPLISAQEYLVGAGWLRALLSPPKLCSNSAVQNIHTEKRQLHKTECCALFPPLSFTGTGGRKKRALPLHHFFSPYQELPALQSLIIPEDVALWWCKIRPLTPLWLLHVLRDTP